MADLVKRFREPPPGDPEYSTVHYEEVALTIRSRGQEGIDFLLGELPGADAARTRAALLALTYPPAVGQPRVRQTLLAYLQDERPLVVAEAIDGLAELGAEEALGQVRALRDHPSPYVRGSVLRFLRRISPETALPELLARLGDPDFIVRENAIDELEELDAVEALPSIRKLLSDPHPDVRRAAQTAVAALESAQHEDEGNSTRGPR
ncbi:MAG: HEAT repeat domain-containing protein [Chloroflexi bacterium]|nr:HEAT repeat domain-containing protein [Chloroflexota bacterium]